MKICEAKSEEEAKCIRELFLRALPRAYYKEVNEGHYALALDCYGTVTSPIRKGSDLINHFVLGSLLNGNRNSQELERIREDLPNLCRHFTEKQILAEELESEVDSFFLKGYIDSLKNQELIGQIVCFMESKIYVRLKEGLLGMIPLNKSYKIDLISNTLTDAQGCIYKVGDEILIPGSVVRVKNNTLQFEQKENYVLQRKK